jgi:hypothetical protein
MLKVGTVLKYISSQKYQLSPGLVTFHNYLQHLWDEDEPWSPSLLSHFFDDCLVYPHWNQNKANLRESVQNALEQLQIQERIDLSLQAVRWPDQMQTVEVEKSVDFSDLVNSYLTFQYKQTGSRFRLVPESDKILYALVLHADRTLTVRQFDRKFLIRQGHLEPLRTDLEVHYTNELELETEIPQKIEVAPFVTCRFVHYGHATSANLVRGYVFQKFHEFRMTPLESYPRLFYTLRRMEQFFLRRESDPFYVRLTQELERTLNLLRLGEPLEPSSLTDLQVRAKSALEYVFHGDKLLGLLLRDLEYQMAKAVPAKQRPAMTGALSHLDFVESSEAPSTWPTKNKTTESDLTS